VFVAIQYHTPNAGTGFPLGYLLLKPMGIYPTKPNIWKYYWSILTNHNSRYLFLIVVYYIFWLIS
jgi:hypothetical protein